MWKSRAGYAAENPGHWPSERHGKGEARTALLKGPKPACGNPRLSLWHETQTNRLCLIWRTAVYGPVRTVVWEGRSREAPPIPIRDRMPGFANLTGQGSRKIRAAVSLATECR